MSPHNFFSAIQTCIIWEPTKIKRNKFVKSKSQTSRPENLPLALIFDGKMTNGMNSLWYRCGVDEKPKEPAHKMSKWKPTSFNYFPSATFICTTNHDPDFFSETKEFFRERATEFYYAMAAVHVRGRMSDQQSNIYSTLFESFRKKIPAVKLVFEDSGWHSTIFLRRARKIRPKLAEPEEGIRVVKELCPEDINLGLSLGFALYQMNPSSEGVLLLELGPKARVLLRECPFQGTS